MSKTYTTISGDMWDQIAYTQMGSKSVFSGIWDGILSICKGVINNITGVVNVVIRGLNAVKVPDWVPGIGGKGINIPEIPQLAKGSKSTPDTFIAGERGPEFITNAPGRRYTQRSRQKIYSAHKTQPHKWRRRQEPGRWPRRYFIIPQAMRRR